MSSYLVYEISGSAVALGLTSAARALPLILFSLVGGAVADAVDRRRLLVISQAASAALMGLLTLITLNGAVAVGHIYLVTFGISAANAFYGPARQAVLPAIVPRASMVSAVTHSNVVRIGSTFIGLSVAGALLTVASPGAVFGIIAGFFFAGLPMLTLLAVKSLEDDGRLRTASIQMVREGVRFVVTTPEILTLLLLDFVATFFGAYRQLMPIFAKDILGVGPDGLGMLLSAPGLGALIGSGIVVWLGDVRSKGRMVLLATVLYGLFLLAFALAPGFGGFLPALLIGGLLGGLDAVAGAFRSAIIILRTPDALQGRVQSVAQMFVQGGPAMGGVSAGALAAVAGAPATVFFGGVMCLLSVEAARRKVRQLHEG